MNKIYLFFQKQTRHIIRSQLGQKFFKRYILTIFLPLLIVAGFLAGGLFFVHLNNTITQQEAYVKSISNVWDNPVNQAHSVMLALSSNVEIGYYLQNGYYTRSEKLYSYTRSLSPIFNSIYQTNNLVEEIKIYGKEPDILEVGAFTSMESFPLRDGDLAQLEEIKPNELFWDIRLKAVNQKPEFYAYYKSYSKKYVDFLGYAEIKLNTDFLDEYVALLNNEAFREVNVYLYQKDRLVYEDKTFTVSPDLRSRFMSNQESFGAEKGCNFFKHTEPDFGLDMLILVKQDVSMSGYVIPLAIYTFILISCLFILSAIFFRDIFRLSRRIMLFSLHMNVNRQGDLIPYQEGTASKTDRPDELALLISSFNKMTKRENELHSQIQNLESLSKDAKLAALQAQIHPHFIYGTLETIRMMALQNDDFEVENIVVSFSKLMRYSLNNPSDKSMLFRELEINSHYMNIQLHRFEGRLSFETEVDSHLPDIACPPFMLQPLLENAIVHGVADLLQGCTIMLKVRKESDAYIIQVINDGKVIEDNRLKEVNEMLTRKVAANIIRTDHNGFALHNVSERLALFYQSKASLRLYKIAGKTIAEIKIIIKSEVRPC